jgi:pimeloyl-ACP methyl ester carboxylesterase
MRFTMIFLVCLIAGCGRSVVPEVHNPALILSECPGFSERGKPPLVSGAECGSLAVAENPRKPDGEVVPLSILRLPAIHPAPLSDPLFIIVGGPGQSAVELAEQVFHTFEETRKYRDIVFLDQRGTGSSHPLECEGLAALGSKLTFSEQKPAIQNALRNCANQLGERYQFYTTPYAAEDLEQVRQALGYPTINIWSVSYGTRVALEYMRRYPQAVRTAVLDGVAPVAIALPWSAERDAFASLQRVNQQCADNTHCRLQYGDLVEQAQTVAVRLQQEPVNLTIKHPSTGLPYELEITHELFASALRMALYSRDLARLLPLAIHHSSAGDFHLLAALVALAEQRSGLSGISLGMHYTVLCNEDFPQYQAQNVQASEQFLLLSAVQTTREACEIWPRQPLAPEYFTAVESAVPTLLLSGARDPVTPPVWGEQVRAGLSKAKHAVAPGGHHSITFEGCTSRLIAQFIHTADIDALDISCVERILPLSPYYELHPETLADLAQQPGLEQQSDVEQKEGDD